MDIAEAFFREVAERIGPEKFAQLLKMGGLKPFSHVDLRRFGNVIDPIYDGRYSANMILRTADGAIEAGGGTWLTKEELQEWKEEFSYCFAKLVDAKGGPSEVRQGRDRGHWGCFRDRCRVRRNRTKRGHVRRTEERAYAGSDRRPASGRCARSHRRRGLQLLGADTGKAAAIDGHSAKDMAGGKGSAPQRRQHSRRMATP